MDRSLFHRTRHPDCGVDFPLSLLHVSPIRCRATDEQGCHRRPLKLSTIAQSSVTSWRKFVSKRQEPATTKCLPREAVNFKTTTGLLAYIAATPNFRLPVPSVRTSKKVRWLTIRLRAAKKAHKSQRCRSNMAEELTAQDLSYCFSGMWN